MFSYVLHTLSCGNYAQGDGRFVSILVFGCLIYNFSWELVPVDGNQLSYMRLDCSGAEPDAEMLLHGPGITRMGLDGVAQPARAHVQLTTY